jgi:hypothetical protein
MQKKIANCGVLHHNYIVVIAKKKLNLIPLMLEIQKW